MRDSFNNEGEIDRVLALADQISGDRQKSLLWLRRPLKQFNDQTPEQLVLKGRAGDLIPFLNSLSSGYVR